jgi:hypothetical protein
MKGKDLFQYVLGGLLVVGFFSLLILLVLRVVPAENKDLLNIVVGALIGSFTSVVGYFFGSSAGSAAKEKTISDIATKTNNGNS